MYNYTLNELKEGKSACVNDIDTACDSRLRLMDLGFTSKSEIKAVWRGKNITAYLIKGTLIALRDKDARYINVIIK